MTQTDIDEDLTVIENLDFEPGCESILGGVNCTSAASWLVAGTPCPMCSRGDSLLLCGEHKDHSLERHGWLYSVCSACKQRGFRVRYVYYVKSVEAL